MKIFGFLIQRINKYDCEKQGHVWEKWSCGATYCSRDCEICNWTEWKEMK